MLHLSCHLLCFLLYFSDHLMIHKANIFLALSLLHFLLSIGSLGLTTFLSLSLENRLNTAMISQCSIVLIVLFMTRPLSAIKLWCDIIYMLFLRHDIVCFIVFQDQSKVILVLIDRRLLAHWRCTVLQNRFVLSSIPFAC